MGMYSLNWHKPRCIDLGITFKLDSFTFCFSVSMLPLVSFTVEIYYMKNYWVKRGVYVWGDLLGLSLSPDPGEGEIEY